MNQSIYLIAAETNYHGTLVKIGRSFNCEKRLKQIQTSCPYKLRIVDKFESDDATEEEKAFHSQYSRFRLYGEWFLLPENTFFGMSCDFEMIREGIN